MSDYTSKSNLKRDELKRTKIDLGHHCPEDITRPRAAEIRTSRTVASTCKRREWLIALMLETSIERYGDPSADEDV